MKKIIYSLVIMIAASTLFTSCLEYVEPVGIQQLRTAKADYLDALAQLRLADAELQKANATFVLARAAFQDAQTEWQLIENRIHEYDVQIKAARTQYEVDFWTKEKEHLQITHNTRMAQARQNLANAEENLRVALRNIAAVQNLFTDQERIIFARVLNDYETAFNNYNAKLFGLEQAQAKLWELEYAFKDSTDWEANYQGEIDFFTNEIARAQAALNAIPKKLDLEAWKAEVDNLQDSIDAYNYSRQAIIKDSVQYMVNVYHEGAPCYERKLDAWEEANKVTVMLDAGKWVFKELKDVTPNKPVKPVAPVYSSADARIQWNFVRDYTDAAAKLVYTKFYDLIADYFQNAPFGKDSTTANGGYYANYIAGVVVPNMDTIRINATVDMKDFILNDSTPTPRTYKWKKGNVENTSSGKYGLKGAINILERELVLIDAASNVAAKQTAYNNARNRWLADREYLINKTHLVEEAAALANMKTSVVIPTPGANDGRAEDLIYAIKDFRGSRTADGTNSSYADTMGLINAIKDFFNAKKAYIGNPFKGYDSITFKNAMDEDTKVFLGDLEYAPFKQKETGAGPVFSSIYGGKNYQTVVNNLNKAADEVVYGANTFKYDAILKVLNAIFPNNAADLTQWSLAENWIDAAAPVGIGTNHLVWEVYKADGTQVSAAKVGGYDKTKADLNLDGIGTKNFLVVYNRFWGTAAVDMATAKYKDDAGCYTEATFKDPYRLVRFTGANINHNTDLAVVLSLVDPEKATFPNSGDWDQAAINNNSAIFGDVGTGGSEFYKMLHAEQLLFIEMAKTSYSAALADLKAYVAQVEADFDAKKAAMDAAYDTAMTKYNTDLTAWNNKEDARKDKIKALLKDLTGKEDGTIVPTIDEPTPNTHNVPASMKKYFDHEGKPVWNGEYALGGKQLAWANECLPGYPAKLKEWMIATRTINHVIGHLNKLKATLDAAYFAAVTIYTFDWQQYVITVNPDHTYTVAVTPMQNNLGAAGAATLADAFKNYNQYQTTYRTDWETYLDKCEEELGYWKKVLAAYNAGYDPLEMAIKEQKIKIEKLEKELEVLKNKLALAEADYKAIIAKLLK